MQNSKFKIQKHAVLFCIFNFAFLISACSIPNLEKPECIEARQTVKDFYSLHFGNEMRPSAEYLKLREKFLTDDWKFFVSKNLNDKHDYFTLTEDYPKAFRVGGCEVTEPNRTVFSVLLFWKDDVRSEQREIKVEAIKENGKWLINKIFQ